MSSKKSRVQEIALERIYRLFELAEKELSKENCGRSKRYVELALKIRDRNRARMPVELKAKYCKKCRAFLKAGKNAKVRVSGKMVVVSCLECGAVKKTGEKEKKAKRAEEKKRKN